MVPRLITPPTAEPISIEDCRTHLRLVAEGSPPEHEHDSMILAQLGAAREWAENFTGRALAPQTLEVALDAFPCDTLALPRTPIAAIVSVRYIDEAGALQTLSPTAYVLDVYSEPARLVMAADFTFPTLSATAVNPVVVRYEAGYGLAGDSPQLTPALPASIRAALLLILGDLYENAEDANDLNLQQIPRGAEALLRPFRIESSLA
jgi:uncharacterized phiE125 gp8 family phage protein